MALYHFSENPDIAVFRPHIAKTSAIQDEAPLWRQIQSERTLAVSGIRLLNAEGYPTEFAGLPRMA